MECRGRCSDARRCCQGGAMALHAPSMHAIGKKCRPTSRDCAMAACFDGLLTAALHAGLQVLCGRYCVYGVRLPFECAGQAPLHHRNVCVCRAMHVQRLQQWVAQTWRERLSDLGGGVWLWQTTGASSGVLTVRLIPGQRPGAVHHQNLRCLRGSGSRCRSRQAVEALHPSRLVRPASGCAAGGHCHHPGR